MYILLISISLISVITFIVLQNKTFGKKSSTHRLERIKKSPNYKNDQFQNLSITPMMAEDASYLKMIKSYFWNEVKTEPDYTLPAIKTDLKNIDITDKPLIIWFGHSSLFIKLKGKNILVDPVFSERPSPFQFAGSKSYPGTRIYSVNDLPNIDYVIITHDHYDHLDYETIDQLKEKVQKFYMPLGVGSHFEHWGVANDKIKEFDWWESDQISNDIKLISTPARHFSGRSLNDRNSTLWTSYVISTPEFKIYVGGDSGYGEHFKIIGEKFGPFDIAILESGQYNSQWPYIHMLPEQTVQACMDLKGKTLLPVHWGKFTLAMHSWNEPIARVTQKASENNVKLTTPLIGEPIIIDSLYPTRQWWVLN